MQYFFTDAEVDNGSYFYQLKALDENQNQLISEQVEVVLTKQGAGGLLVYPNPSNGMVTVQLSGSAAAMKVDIMDAKGSVVFQTEGTGYVLIPGQQLPSGFYIVKCLSEGNISLEQLVIE